MEYTYPFQRRFHIKFDFDWPSGLEEIFLNGGRTDGRRADAGSMGILSQGLLNACFDYSFFITFSDFCVYWLLFGLL